MPVMNRFVLVKGLENSLNLRFYFWFYPFCMLIFKCNGLINGNIMKYLHPQVRPYNR